jgi:hypothetical protein
VEIQRNLSKSGNQAVYRPAIYYRVFHIKLEEMMADFESGKVFGRVIAGVYLLFFHALHFFLSLIS